MESNPTYQKLEDYFAPSVRWLRFCEKGRELEPKCRKNMRSKGWQKLEYDSSKDKCKFFDEISSRLTKQKELKSGCGTMSQSSTRPRSSPSDSSDLNSLDYKLWKWNRVDRMTPYERITRTEEHSEKISFESNFRERVTVSNDTKYFQSIR